MFSEMYAYDRIFFISFANWTNTKLKYVLEQRKKGREVLFWLQIKSECLAAWRRQLLDRPAGVGRYIDLVNLNMPGNAFRLNPSSMRLESRLYEIGNLAEAKRKTLNWNGSPTQGKKFLGSCEEDIPVTMTPAHKVAQTGKRKKEEGRNLLVNENPICKTKE